MFNPFRAFNHALNNIVLFLFAGGIWLSAWLHSAPGRSARWQLALGMVMIAIGLAMFFKKQTARRREAAAASNLRRSRMTAGEKAFEEGLASYGRISGEDDIPYRKGTNVHFQFARGLKVAARDANS